MRLGAPDAEHDHALAVDRRHLAHLAVGEAGQIVVDGQLAEVPALSEAVGGPAADAVDGRLGDVDGAGLQRQLRLGEHRILVGLLVEDDLDARTPFRRPGRPCRRGPDSRPSP